MNVYAILALTVCVSIIDGREISQIELVNDNLLKTIIELVNKTQGKPENNRVLFDKPASCAEVYLQDSTVQSKNLFDPPSNCAEIFSNGINVSGVYIIYPRTWFRNGPSYKPMSFQVYCDMDTDGGGWTVFQRRGDFEPQENFNRNWSDYRKGFGQLDKEFWLGNDKLYVLTNQDYVTLRVDLEDPTKIHKHAIYKTFRVADWQDKFRAEISGYTGDAGDSLIKQATNATFVTYDDGDVNSCAKDYKGGWWYTKCYDSNLNGVYVKEQRTSEHQGVVWKSFKNDYTSLKRTEMKVRPTAFNKF